VNRICHGVRACSGPLGITTAQGYFESREKVCIDFPSQLSRKTKEMAIHIGGWHRSSWNCLWNECTFLQHDSTWLGTHYERAKNHGRVKNFAVGKAAQYSGNIYARPLTPHSNFQSEIVSPIKTRKCNFRQEQIYWSCSARRLFV
jgi:hypothetical protein